MLSFRRPGHAERLRPGPRRAILTLILLGAAAISATPATAGAATYTVWNCANASGQPLDTGDWSGSTGGTQPERSSVSGGCSRQGSGVGMLRADVNTPFAPRGINRGGTTGATWAFHAGQSTLIRQLDLWWAASAIFPASISVDAPSLVGSISGSGAFGGAAFGRQDVAYSEANHQAFRGLSTDGVYVRAGCACPAAQPNLIAWFEIYRSRATVEDLAAPSGTVQGLQSQQHARIAGPVALSAAATDVGAGVRDVTLRVDGHVVQRVAAGDTCTDVDPSNADPNEYAVMHPCPYALPATLTLTSAQLNGDPQQAAVVATDASGQDTVLGQTTVARAAPAGFHDANGFVNPDLNITAARAGNGSNAGPANAALSFVRKRHGHTHLAARRLVSSTTRAPFRGRLTTPTGTAIVDARVWIATAVHDGQWRLASKPLTTSKTGRVHGRLPAKQPSRDVQLIYFPFSDNSTTHATSPVRRLGVPPLRWTRGD